MARKTVYDEMASKELRNLVISSCIDVIKKDEDVTEKWSAYKKELILRMSPRVLPVLQELSGKDGGAIEISGVDIVVRK